MVASFNGSFDIRNFIDKLTPSRKGKNYYICPGCGGSSLHINPDNGAYKCFSNGCESKIIREAVAPLGNKKIAKPAAKPAKPAKPAKTKPRMKPVIAPVALQSPRPITAGEYKGNQYQIKYKYSDTQYVVRYEYQKNGQREKYFTPHHIDSDGVVVAKKGDKPWPLYNSLDVEMWGGGNWINDCEGEKNADYLVSIGIVACSVTGTASEADIRYGYQQAISSGMMGIIYHQDNDLAGENKAKKHKKIADDMGIPFIICPAKELYPDIKEKGDIADLIADGIITKESLVAFLDNKIKEFVENDQEPLQEPLLTLAIDNTKPSEDPLCTFNQIAVDFLYKKEGYKAINGKLAKWEGKYYEIKTDDDELKRISDFCNSYPVVAEQEDDKPKITYPFAKPKIWKEVFECAKTRLHIGSKNFQTTGINCTNGVLSINWEGKKPIINFENHDPEKHFFTSEPLIEYNPLADSTYCNQLLLCLDPNQRQILLRNLAASLDILSVRKFHGRTIKLLLCIGGGSNGKDSIREVVSLIFGGKGMTSFSLDDFIDYDRGIKNSLAGLELSRVNWASESTKTTRLDNSKSLKSFATGDTLIARYLHKDGVPFIPQSVGLFNLNELPNLYGTSQAAMDRFAPITFEKTFVSAGKYDPANKNHMIADPRFKYDPQFIAKAVAPAFLNCLLQELHNLMELGIDYSCTENKLDQIQKDNNHLFDFCESINLEYRENAIISVSELWQHLEKYYFDQEILSLDTSGNRRWADPVKPSDKYVKGANQVYDRLQAIFPDISSHSMRLNGATKPTKFIKGISIQLNTPKQKNIPTPVYTPVDTPVIPQLYPSYTPVEKPANPDTAKVLPSSYTPYTPVSSNYSEKKSKEELDPNFGAKTSQTIPQNSADDDGTEENKKSLGQTGVYGVYEAAETLTTTETEGDPNWGITGVYFEETGGKLGYKSEEVVDSSTNVQAVTTDTTPSIKMQLGDFKVGDRIQVEPQAIPDYKQIAPVIAKVTSIQYGDDGLWEVVSYEYERWNNLNPIKYQKDFGRGAVLSGWVKKLVK